MRKTTFVALAVLIISCTSTEKASERLATTTSIVETTFSFDPNYIFNILAREGLVKTERHRMKVSIVTEHLVDINDPATPTNYVAILIQYKDPRPTNIAVFDASNNMRLVALLEQEFPDVLTYFDHEGIRDSGQGPDLSPQAMRLSDAGDVISITAKSGKQFTQGGDEDEDVWLFGLWKSEVVMLMGYPQKFHHLDTSNKGWYENTWVSNKLTIAPTKSKGMYDILLNGHRKVSSDTKSDNEDVDTFVKYIFNGKEYIEI